MSSIGIGFIGAGFAAELHAHALAPLRGVRSELVAVFSQTRERAEAFAKRFGIPHVDTDHRALLFAVDAAEAGKHVIVEKPR